MFEQPVHVYVLAAYAVIRLVAWVYVLVTVLERILPEWPQRIPTTVSTAVLVGADMTIIFFAERFAVGVLVVLCCGLIEITYTLAEVRADPEINPDARTS